MSPPNSSAADSPHVVALLGRGLSGFATGYWRSLPRREGLLASPAWRCTIDEARKLAAVGTEGRAWITGLASEMLDPTDTWGVSGTTSQ